MGGCSHASNLTTTTLNVAAAQTDQPQDCQLIGETDPPPCMIFPWRNCSDHISYKHQISEGQHGCRFSVCSTTGILNTAVALRSNFTNIQHAGVQEGLFYGSLELYRL